MTTITEVNHSLLDKDVSLAHCYNQANIRLLRNGELVVVYNEERFPYHHDTGQTVLIRSRDGGQSWDPSTRQVVLPYTDLMGNWDCGIAELDDGTLIINLTQCAFFKRGIRATMPSWSAEPMTEEWGDWTWSYRLRNWIGTFVLKSPDNGATWTAPIPVNVLPLKHAGTRLGCWPMPDGSLLMGVYGRIRGYNEEEKAKKHPLCLLRSDDGGDS
ncbi:MAG: exo-alpha-sialidase [Chloroflexi bacterium]|nr:exo-alpha-sialidase [Chloroflexota bacterium]